MTKQSEINNDLNLLIKKVEELVVDSTDIDVDRELFDIWNDLKRIKEKFTKNQF